MKVILRSMLKKFDLALVKNSTYQKALSDMRMYEKFSFTEILREENLAEYFESRRLSKSQLGQDLFVLNNFNFKRDGFFVEFGATNGVDLSNTYLLEKNFGWSGILAEPAKLWHEELFKNRNASIDTDCVWKRTGEILDFNEVNDNIHSGELSTIDSFSSMDGHGVEREGGKKYSVRSISLVDLLVKHSAPDVIDYLSIDTEGSEYEIVELVQSIN